MKRNFKTMKKGGLSSNQMINSILVKKDGQQPSLQRGMPTVKFVDIGQTVNVTSTGAVLSGLCPITQGVGVSQRTGDTVFWKDIFINYSISSENADIFNLARVILFQWHPNSGLAVPIVTDILQTNLVYSMYDWQFSSQFKILYDKVHVMAGTGTNPTPSGNQGYFGSIPITGPHRAEFSAGSALGAEQFYILAISDSVAIPFPTLSIQSRVTYSEE